MSSDEDEEEEEDPEDELEPDDEEDEDELDHLGFETFFPCFSTGFVSGLDVFFPSSYLGLLTFLGGSSF